MDIINVKTGHGKYMNEKNKKISLLFFVVLCFLCSCGDETSKVVESKSLDYESYESIEDLPDCSDENEGQMVWVAEESQLRICADEKWYAMMPKDSSGQKDPNWNLSCWTKMNKDSTGYSIICNGDSIGFVHNGKLVESEVKNEDEECSVLFVSDDTLKVACDSLVSVLVRDSSGNMEPQEMELDSEQIALDLENIGGFSQKGPFVTGSEVTVYELQNGRTLKQTGKSFKGSITDDKGSFNVRTVKVASQYAYLVAKGAYLSEINAEKSDAQIQLSAITDLRNRNTANINLLTHLEYERVVYLVTKKKKTVAEAKKQAQKEIFSAFHVDSKVFSGTSEDFSIGGTGEEDAALLAVSILLQKDDKTADLSKRINAISASIADSGLCESSMLLDIADWASRADSLNLFPKYSKNVEKMGLSAKVADFEKYIRNFWNSEYGLGDCDSLGKIVAAKRGSLKDSASRFVCEEKYGAHSWRYALIEEREIYKKAPAADGTLDEGASGDIYVYDSVLAISNFTGWRLADSIEAKFGECRKVIDSMIISVPSNYEDDACYDSYRLYYWCDGEKRKWTVARDCFIVDTYGWSPSTDGDVRYGDSIAVGYASRNCYTYDSLDGAWRHTDAKSCTYNVRGCTRATIGQYFKGDYDSYYRCRDDLSLSHEDSYITKNIWSYDCEPWVNGVVNTDDYFVCENEKWRIATDDEVLVGAPCFDQKDTTYSSDSVYACYTGLFVEEFSRQFGSGWKKTANFDKPKNQKDYLNDSLTYGSIVDSRDGRIYKTIEIGGDTWMAENMLYFDKRVMSAAKSCYGDRSPDCEMWRIYDWPVAMDVNGQYLSSSAKDLISENHRGICPEGWHIPTIGESEALLAAAGSFDALLSAKRRLLHTEDLKAFQDIAYWGGSIDEMENIVTGTNSSGFSAVCGYTFVPGSEKYYDLPDTKICWWTSSEEMNTLAQAFCVGIEEEHALIETRSKEDGLPVRCVQDKMGE